MYRQAKGFVQRSKALRKFRAFDGYRRVDYRAHNSFIEIMASDDRTGDGIIPTLCILDELHRHKNMGLYETWSGKLDKRSAQLIAISTAGEPGGELDPDEQAARSARPTATTTANVLLPGRRTDGAYFVVRPRPRGQVL
jgi:hypothetical protein